MPGTHVHIAEDGSTVLCTQDSVWYWNADTAYSCGECFNEGWL